MTQEATRQADNVVPPRKGACAAIVLDATSRSYDLSLVDLGAAYSRGGELYIRLFSETATTYFFMSPANSGTVDETAAVAAAGTMAFTANACSIIPAGTEREIRINRTTDRYLFVKGSGAGYLRISASSQPSATTATSS